MGARVALVGVSRGVTVRLEAPVSNWAEWRYPLSPMSLKARFIGLSAVGQVAKPTRRIPLVRVVGEVTNTASDGGSVA
jgi:hypothetical protein